MLRITRSTKDGATVLVLEGKLLAPWAPAVLELCAEGPGAAPGLDLSRVSFVDAEGLALLNQLRARGARVVACSDFVAELLHAEIS